MRLEHVRAVVKPLQHARLRVEEESLHAVMRGDVVGPCDFEHAPGSLLAIFGMRREFRNREVWA